MQGKVEICGVNTSKLKTLSNDEMMRLIRASQAGDSDARKKLVEGNLKLVLSVIQRFIGRGENPDDLFQVGCIGLLKAIANFDTTKPVRFSTYGVPMIAGELRRYLRDYSPIRISRSVRDTAYHVLQCKDSLTSSKGREPTLEEIAKALGIPLEEVVSAMQIAALNPRFWDKSDVTADVLEEEKKILVAQMDNDPKMASKPQQVKEKIASGKLNKFYEENCLLQQSFVKDGDVTVEQYMNSAAKALGGSVKFVNAIRYEKGEGIEKKQENFAEEVAAQMNMTK